MRGVHEQVVDPRRAQPRTGPARPPRRLAGPRVQLAAVLAATLLWGCAAPGDFIRAEELPASATDDDYRIGVGDVLSIRVWNQEPMSTARARVREDGKVSVPFLQDVEARGRTPAELGTVLKARFMAYVVSPMVTVALEEAAPLRIPVVGEVTRPGVYELDGKAGVLTALAAAGRFTELARRDAIYVLRYQLPIGERVPLRIRFEYRLLAQGDRPSASFRLRHGDVVVVE
jgi:polysaccharide export outer membrane protein